MSEETSPEAEAPKERPEYNLVSRIVRYAGAVTDGVLEGLPQATQYNWMPYNLADKPVEIARKLTAMPDDASDLEKKVQAGAKEAVEAVGEVGEAVAAGYSIYTLIASAVTGSSAGWFAPMYLDLKALTNGVSLLARFAFGDNSYFTNMFKAEPKPAEDAA
ncbi:MAG: hypothetical protein ACE5FT_00930 [Candidatus Nanoarchaeia archaeon]